MTHSRRDTTFDEKTRKAKEAAMQKAVQDLQDAGFDVVVFLGTSMLEDGSTDEYRGIRGNWYAINGLLRAALTQREHVAKLEAEDAFFVARGDDAVNEQEDKE